MTIDLDTRPGPLDDNPLHNPRTCGRPTKAGTPCKGQLAHKFQIACHSHATVHERELADAQYEAYWAGHRAGKKWTDDVHRIRVENLERQIEQLQSKVDAAYRRFSILDDQIVEVDGFAYRWSGEPLAVGDRVWLPANWLSEIKYGPGLFEGTVTALGSTYSGHLSEVVRRVES